MGAKKTRAVLVAALTALLALGAITSRPVAAADGPTVSIGDQTGLERDDLIGSVFMPITLSEAVEEPVTVSFYTVNQSAVYIPPEDRDDPLIFGDYQRRGTPEIPRTVTIPAGSVQSSINVPINIDDEVEDDETFAVVIASVDGGNAVVGNDTGTATIVDSDGLAGPNPVINVSSTSIHEGDDGQRRAQFQVHLSRAPLSNVTISYTTSDGTAVAGEDYVQKFPGSVVFAPGQISKTIDVLVNPNTSIDGPREFSLEVSVTGGSPVEELAMVGIATILEDDEAPVLPIVPAVTAGNEHTCALDSEGVVKCWGSGVLGQLGDGTSTSSLSPVTVTALPPRIASVVAGNAHTCALTELGGVKCWGDNSNGELGNSTFTPSALPIDVPGLTSGVSVLEVGDAHTCAALTAGGVKCWGWASSGQLGHGVTALNSPTPVDVVGLPTGVAVSSMSASYRHTCASFADGSVRCWGRNNEGQLGNGNNTTSRVAVQPVGLTSGVSQVSVGGATTCVLQNDQAKCFGKGTSGHLGNGLLLNSNVPVTVVDPLTSYSQAAVGGDHSCGLTEAGGAKCWGLNQEGQLGINQPSNVLPLSSLPLQVNGLASGQISLSSNIAHSCSMAADESVRCWGRNLNGQLGNGNTSQSTTPVLVAGL